MALHALDDIGDAADATKALLLPFEWGRWLRLAVVALFVGGATGPPTGFGPSFDRGTGVEPGPWPGLNPGAVVPDLDSTGILVLVGLGLLAATVALLFAVVGSVMEFVFFESLGTETVRIRRYAGSHIGDGLRLLAFRIALFLLGALPVALLIGLFVLAPPLGLLALLGLPILLVYFALLGVVNGFTTMFVVPTMLIEDCGVLAGWRRLWPTVRGNLTEFGAYAVLGLLLTVGAGIAVGFGVFLAAFLLAIPAGLLFGVPAFLLPDSAGLVVLALGGLLYAAGLLVAVGLAKAPVQTFLRYYALFLLGDADADLDLIPGRRAAVRADGRPDDANANDSDDERVGDGPDGDSADEPSDARDSDWSDDN